MLMPAQHMNDRLRHLPGLNPRPATTGDEQLVIDLPLWCHLPKVLLLWLPTEVSLLLLLLFSTGAIGPLPTCFSVGEPPCEAAICGKWAQDFRITDEAIDGIVAASSVATGLMIVELMAYFLLLYLAWRYLARRPYLTHKVPNMGLKWQASPPAASAGCRPLSAPEQHAAAAVLRRRTGWHRAAPAPVPTGPSPPPRPPFPPLTQRQVRLFPALCFVVQLSLLWYVKIGTTESYLLTILGAAPVQLALTAVVVANAFVATPNSTAWARRRALHRERCQRFVWLEAQQRPDLAVPPLPGETVTVPPCGPAGTAAAALDAEPCFCFETALKCFVWSSLSYELKSDPSAAEEDADGAAAVLNDEVRMLLRPLPLFPFPLHACMAVGSWQTRAASAKPLELAAPPRTPPPCRHCRPGCRWKLLWVCTISTATRPFGSAHSTRAACWPGVMAQSCFPSGAPPAWPTPRQMPWWGCTGTAKDQLRRPAPATSLAVCLKPRGPTHFE